MINSIITSIVTTFLIIRLYLNWHYRFSMACFREKQIELTTYKIVEQFKIEALIIDHLIVENQMSFGLFFKRLITTYGIIDDNKNVFPLLFNDIKSMDWNFYIENIQPVRADLNNNSFLGWFSFILNVKKLNVLWEMCNISELIISDVIILSRKYPKMFEIVNSDCFVMTDVADYVLKENLVQKYCRLKDLWFLWLKLNKI